MSLELAKMATFILLMQHLLLWSCRQRNKLRKIRQFHVLNTFYKSKTEYYTTSLADISTRWVSVWFKIRSESQDYFQFIDFALVSSE